VTYVEVISGAGMVIVSVTSAGKMSVRLALMELPTTIEIQMRLPRSAFAKSIYLE